MKMNPDGETQSNRRLNAGCLLTGLPAIVLLLLAWHAGPNVVRHYSLLLAGPLLGISLGLLLIRLNALELSGPAGFSLPESSFVAACGILLALIAYWCGMRQFCGLDLSIIIDIGWRLFNGQRLYVDFPCAFPIGFCLGAEAAFRLFGVYWRSIILFNSIWTCLLFLWLYALLRCLFLNRLLSFWAAFTCVAITMVADSFWWYDPLTSMAGVLYAGSVAAVIIAPCHWGRWVSFCLSLLLLALMKPNVAGVLIIGGTVCLFTFPVARWPAVIFSSLAFLLWLLVIHVHGSTLPQVLGSYLSAGSMGLNFKAVLTGFGAVETHWFERLGGFILLFGLCMPWLKRTRGAPASHPLAFLPYCCLVSGLYGFITDNDLKIVDMPLLLLGALFIAARMQKDGPRLVVPSGWTGYLTFMCVLLTCVGLVEGVVRNRVKGNYLFFQYGINSEPFPVPFFQGMHGGPILHSVVQDIATMMSTQDMSHVFFGNGLGWAYAAFDLQSPKGQPSWWQRGISFPKAEETTYVDDLISRRYNPVLVMDVRYYDDQFRNAVGPLYTVGKEYDFERRWSAPLDILVPRDKARSSPPWRPNEVSVSD
jgi:hypothetical protein